MIFINTPLGFQLQAYYDSWRIFNDCNDLFDLLSSASMSGITMKMLAEMIKDIGYSVSSHKLRASFANIIFNKTNEMATNIISKPLFE